MDNCIFCKIVAGEMGTEFVYEDEDFVTFKDIHPKAKTHLLLVSRKHIPSVMDFEGGDQDLVGRMIGKSREIAEKIGIPGYNLRINVGEAGGQEIFHLHVHLMSNAG